MIHPAEQNRPKVPEHLVPLTEGWSIWRQAVLRGAGFPSSLVKRLRQPETVAAADALLSLPEGAPQAERDAARARFDEAMARETLKVSAVLKDAARMPLLREALAWQNRHALETALDPLLRREAGQRNSRIRLKEALVAKYLMRYCLKNDTVGFFGPVGWVSFSPEAPTSVRPGPQLLAQRNTYFEHWCIDALADALSEDERLRPWITPRVPPYLRVEGRYLHTDSGEKVELTAAEALALSLCSGERTAREVIAALRADASLGVADEAQGMELLASLRARQWMAWRLQTPNLLLHPEQYLRRQLERIEEPALRAEALAPLNELESLRDELTRTAGNAEALAKAFAALEEAFTRHTEQEATRGAGKTYAGRTLVYQECRRDVEVTLGPDILANFAPALSLVLESARWFTSQLGKHHLAAFEDVYERLRGEGTTVEFVAFDPAVYPYFPFIGFTGAGKIPRPDFSKEVYAGLQERWWKLFSPKPGEERRVKRTSAELAAGVKALFTASCPGWPSSRYHTPDLMIAAASREALERGECVVVAGEFHPACNTIESNVFIPHHPRPEELLRGLAADLPFTRISPVMPKEVGTRVITSSFSPDTVEFAFMNTVPSRMPPERVVRAADLVVERMEGQLYVRTRDGSRRWHVMEVYDRMLSLQYINEFPLFPSGNHMPRITLDEVVLSRESWRFSTEALDFVTLDTEAERFLGARAWARRQELPRRVFYRATNETKPFCLDFESPTSVEIFAKMARASPEVSVSEMLPDMDELWLTDAQGETYTAELRIPSVDPRPWRVPGAD